MNFALLWGDGLLICLLWVATIAAFAGRLRRRWIRGLLMPITVGVPLFFLGSFVFVTTASWITTQFKFDLSAYSISLLAAFLIGAWIILRCSRSKDAGLNPGAVTWPRGILLFGLTMSIGFGYMTLMNMDLVMHARSAIQGVQANTRYWAALPAVPSNSQNAATYYEKAFAELRADLPLQVNNPPIGKNDLFDPEEPATIDYLKRHQSLIDLLRHAAALPGCRFDADLSDPEMDVRIADLNQERGAANVLNLHAREELAHGNIASAMIDADSILRMSRHVGQRPLIISGMVGIAIAAIGNKTLEQVMPCVTSAKELSLLHLDQLDPIGQAYQESLRGEEVFGLMSYDQMPSNPANSRGGFMSSSDGGPLGILVRVLYFNSDNYVQLIETLQDLCVQPYYITRPQLDAACNPKNVGGYLSVLVPSLRRNFEPLAKIDAESRCAEVAVAATKFRLDHGMLPAHLVDLIPNYLEAVPDDPFDGKPLRLTIPKNQWIVYSVGPNGVDDGGIGKPNHKGDVTFTLHSPPG